MPLYNVRGALQGPVTNPEAKRRNDLKKLIAQFQVNPYSVSDDPRSYYKQLKAMAMQEGLPMALPQTLEKNPLGVGAYEAADTALFGLLPNRDYLSETEKTAAGIGGAVGMIPTPWTGLGIAKGIGYAAGKVAPGLAKVLPKSMQSVFKAKKVVDKTKAGSAMKKSIDKFHDALTKSGIDPKKFTGASGKEREFIRTFLKDNVDEATSTKFNSFRTKFVEFLSKDKRFKYQKGKGANLSKLRFDPTKENAFVAYNDTFRKGISGLKDGKVGTLMEYAVGASPELKQKLIKAIAENDTKTIKALVKNIQMQKVWAGKGGKNATEAWNTLDEKSLSVLTNQIDSMTIGLQENGMNFLNLKGSNPLLSAMSSEVRRNIGPEVSRFPGMPVGNIMPPAI